MLFRSERRREKIRSMASQVATCPYREKISGYADQRIDELGYTPTTGEEERITRLYFHACWWSQHMKLDDPFNDKQKKLGEYWKWDRLILLGHSMGASVATLFAGTFPEKVDKLVLLEALGPLTSPADEAPERLKRSLSQYAQLPQKKLPIYATVERAIEVRRQVSGMSTEATAPIVLRGIKEISGGFTWRTDPRLKIDSPSRMTEDQIGRAHV